MHTNMSYYQKSKHFVITKFNNSIDKFTILHSKRPIRNINEIDFDTFTINSNNQRHYQGRVIDCPAHLRCKSHFLPLLMFPRSLLSNLQFHPLSPPPISPPP